MTRDEIRKMPAGKELDFLIARRFNLYTIDPQKGDWYDVVGSHVFYVRQFSTDIAAALELLHAVADSFGILYADSQYLVNVLTPVKGFAYAGTLALAASRAALLAVAE